LFYFIFLFVFGSTRAETEKSGSYVWSRGEFWGLCHVEKNVELKSIILIGIQFTGLVGSIKLKILALGEVQIPKISSRCVDPVTV